METIPMTAPELDRLRKELHTLQREGRAEIAARIKTAREWGDLKENGEYHAAKEAQAHLETTILKLEAQVRNAEVVEAAGKADVVKHGSTVTYTDREKNRTQTFRIVAPHEAAPSDGRLSASSPIARALLGRHVGDVIEVKTPTGVRALHIDSIS